MKILKVCCVLLIFWSTVVVSDESFLPLEKPEGYDTWSGRDRISWYVGKYKEHHGFGEWTGDLFEEASLSHLRWEAWVTKKEISDMTSNLINKAEQEKSQN